ncbi:MAG: precorrin-2 C(20)-methyltransferase [Peptococcaceae bacterium]|nr:precorrin-2 C(20)-methyltransferase [Peptococcaceae bacterium]
MLGKFYGLGVGPGDPKLLTLKAVEVLNAVPVVAVPKSRVDRESVALHIVKPYLSDRVQLLELDLPMTPDPLVLEMAWQAGAERILDVLQEGLDVAFLTIGDVSLYSTYQYVLQKLQGIAPEVEVETVPGITSFAASAALLNEPLASGNEPLLILPSVDDDVAHYLRQFPNLVLMKVSRDFDKIVQKLQTTNKQGVFVSRCGSEQQKVIRDLNSLVGTNVDYLSLILVRESNSKEGDD